MTEEKQNLFIKNYMNYIFSLHGIVRKLGNEINKLDLDLKSKKLLFNEILKDCKN